MKREPPRVPYRASGEDSAEQTRRREVARVLEKINLSLEEEQIIESLSYSLVAKLLLGPIPGAVARATQAFERG